MQPKEEVKEEAKTLGQEIVINPLFIIDDQLPEIEQIERYVFSTADLQRCLFTKRIASCAKQIGTAAVKRRIIPLVRRMLGTTPSLGREVRLELPEQLCTIALQLLKDPSAYSIVKDDIVAILCKLLEDESVEVRCKASASLSRVAMELEPDDTGTVLLAKVLLVAHSEKDEHRTTAVATIASLTHLLDLNLCSNFICPELASFSDDPSFRVRKAAAIAFGPVCTAIGTQLTETKLLPLFLKLTRDRIWAVRKGCLESVVGVAAVLSPHTRASMCADVFSRFSTDTSRWVRNGMYEKLGKMIYTLGPKLAGPQLIARFASIPQLDIDENVVFHCAFFFPAVVHTIGPARFSEVVPLFRKLVQDSKFVVRRTIAHSLHEVAAIVGPELSVQHLLFAFDLLLRDLDEVRVGVVSHLASFLRCLPPKHRDPYAVRLWSSVVQHDKQWRWRLRLADQLAELLTVFGEELVGQHLVPILLQLLTDSVVTVREAAVLSVGAFVCSLAKSQSTHFTTLTQSLHKFGMSVSCFERHTFVGAAVSVALADPELFRQLFEARFHSLATDSVLKVRLAVARGLATVCKAQSSLRDVMLKQQREFTNDPNPHVQAIAQDALGLRQATPPGEIHPDLLDLVESEDESTGHHSRHSSLDFTEEDKPTVLRGSPLPGGVVPEPFDEQMVRAVGAGRNPNPESLESLVESVDQDVLLPSDSALPVRRKRRRKSSSSADHMAVIQENESERVHPDETNNDIDMA